MSRCNHPEEMLTEVAVRCCCGVASVRVPPSGQQVTANRCRANPAAAEVAAARGRQRRNGMERVKRPPAAAKKYGSGRLRVLAAAAFLRC